MTLKVVSLFLCLTHSVSYSFGKVQKLFIVLQAMRSSRGIPGLTVWSE